MRFIRGCQYRSNLYSQEGLSLTCLRCIVDPEGELDLSDRVSEGLAFIVLNSSPLILVLVRVWVVRSSKASNSLPSPQIFLGLRFFGLVSSLADDGIATLTAGIEILGGRILAGFDFANEEAVGAVNRLCEKLNVDLAFLRLGCVGP